MAEELGTFITKGPKSRGLSFNTQVKPMQGLRAGVA